ncbi:hypothetical protein LJC25_05015 [Bacteroidales bacterium OttesenSCG-928-K03]|nr:hypothetical protein [Bacteroidales bacterium OttesenSCG-928-K03]
MKKLFIFSIFLLVISSCEKPIIEPPEKPEQKTKFLAEIIYYDKNNIANIAESCVWDSLGRLVQFNTFLRNFPYENFFHYNIDNQISRIDFKDRNYGGGYYEFHWTDENLIEYIDLFLNDQYTHRSRYTYEYDNIGRCIQINRNEPFDTKYRIDWSGNNIIRLFDFNSNNDTIFYINNPKYDTNPCIYSALPKIPIIHFSGVAYNPSENNIIETIYNNGDISGCLYYDYDNDNYPYQAYIMNANIKRIIYKIKYK